MVRLHVEPLPGNPYHGRAFGAWVNYYALAPDLQVFAEKIKGFVAHEKWTLIEMAESGTTSRERLASKPWILESLDQHGDFAMIAAGQFSSD
jgi:hypothetical protein